MQASRSWDDKKESNIMYLLALRQGSFSISVSIRMQVRADPCNCTAATHWISQHDEPTLVWQWPIVGDRSEESLVYLACETVYIHIN